MLSHFVRKDAKNWDEYVPYAVMAYRAMPHCSTKYSPYYMVFGRDMRLPIEGDWRPKRQEAETGENSYEDHVRALALRLHEANKIAGQHSRASHETAKRYYDKQTKLEQFKKGDLVDLHDPVHKRGKAKKFSYQFKGAFEIESKISPLIYRIRTGEGMSAVVHIHRLKRAYGQKPGTQTSTTKPCTLTGNSLNQPHTKPSQKEESEFSDKEITLGITSNPQVESEDSDSMEEMESGEVLTPRSVRRGQEDPDWEPSSVYLQRKL
jgi:hypothetical protein